MIRLGMIGADSFHALAFSRLANLPKEQGGSGLSAQVCSIWGENAERTEFVAQQANIPQIVKSPAEMLGMVDAVMVVTRNGDNHLSEALPFIKAKIPTWIDKPFTCNEAQAEEIICLAQKNKIVLSGGSACKYSPDVLHIKNELCRIGGREQLISAHFNFPAELNGPYGGLHFYAPHTAEILATVFGRDIKSIKADVTAGTLIGIFKYDSFAVSVTFAEVSRFICMLYGRQEVVEHGIDITDIYRYSLESFVNEIMQVKAPEPFEALLWPIKLVNTLKKAAESGKEIVF